MYCKECGTENMDNALKCKKCNVLMNNNLPLDGSERVKIIITFLLCLSPPFWIVGIILITSLYIMKKDKDFNLIRKTQTYIKIYYIPMIIFCLSAACTHIDGGLNISFELYILISIISSCIAIAITIWIFDNFFFRILFNHEMWIIDNNLFADSKNEKSILDVLTKEIKNKPLDSTNELLKWAELKEKGLITEEEFIKAKEKILEGKL